MGNLGCLSDHLRSPEANHDSGEKEEKSPNTKEDALVTQKDKNEKLFQLCFAELLDLNAIVELLSQGAEAGYEQRQSGS